MIKSFQLCFKYFLLLCLASVHAPLTLYAMDLPEGVRPLVMTDKASLSSHVSSGVMFLNEPSIIAKFLENLEGTPPNWTYLYGSNVDERYDRLFDETEKRDEARAGHVLLNQRIAFVWYGNLTTYRPEQKGFGVAIGPMKIQTNWGIVRFKIANAPFEMIAVPPADQLNTIQDRRARGEEVNIQIMYSGSLMEAESVLFDFSTVKKGEGMILPIVMLDQVDYLLIQ